MSLPGTLTWTEDADSRQDLGPSGIIQKNTATFNLSDYPMGGYPIDPHAFGMARIRSLIPCGMTGAARGWEWEYNNSQQPIGHLQAYGQNATTGPLVETASNTDFSANGGTLSLLAFGY